MATTFASYSKSSGQVVPGKAGLAVPLAALAVLLALQSHLVLTRSINWDEFFYFGQIAGFADGTATKPLQTLHVRLFGWLLNLPGLGVDQIIAGRVVMFGCLIGTATAISIIARKFVDRNAAILAAAAYLCAGFVMQHGWSFRTDPLAAMFVTTSLAILARAPLRTRWIVAFGLLLGLAGMVTMKSILIAPAFVGLAWLRWSEGDFSAPVAIRLAAMPIAALASFSLIYSLHLHFMPATLGSGTSYAASASKSMFFFGLPEYGNYARAAVLTSLPLVVMVVLTPRAARSRNAASIAAICGLLAPLLSVFFYHNTLPYYYAFMLPAVTAGSAIALPILIERLGTGLVSAVIVLNGAVIWAYDGESRLDQQRAIQEAASIMFPEPVSYFDFPNFLPNHSKANTFLTHWGFEGYRQGSGPSFAKMMQDIAVPLELTVDPTYDPTLLAAMEQSERSSLFRDEDRDVLARTYRQFWGPFWLAGTEIQPDTIQIYSVRVPGPYTVSGTDLTIDGRLVRDGEVLDLERREIQLKNTSVLPATLTWGENIQVPQKPPPARPYWTDF